MSEVRLVVREANRDWSGTIHGSCAERAVAALSADPMTLEELEAAVARFVKPSRNRGYLANLREGLCDEPYDAGLVLIDLAARLIVAESTYFSPSTEGGVAYHDGQSSTNIVLPYHLAGDWLISDNAKAWRPLADRRRRERAEQPDFDAREVFYGRPMIEFIAREVFAAFGRRDQIAAEARARWTEEARSRLAKAANVAPEQIDPALLTDEAVVPKTWPGQEEYASPFRDSLKEIHSAWLLTPRDELGGLCPREVAVERRGHISWDLQDRSQQWSRMGRCPPGLAKSSHACRRGGFGTHELVKYYDLIRELLWSCWDQLTAEAQATGRSQSLTAGDFLAAEVPRLEGLRDAWLDEPDPECHGRTPRSVIERERRRLPEAVSGAEALHDPDCPCCQMMAEMPGPFFWGLDGSSMDDEFAFAIWHRTRAEWEEEQRQWEEFSRRMDAERSERAKMGIPATPMGADASPFWSRSFQVNDSADVPMGVRVFGIGCRLAGLIVRLRGDDREHVPEPARSQIDSLNRHFGNLREVLQSSDMSLIQALIDPAIERFVEALREVGSDRPDLAERCESLTGDLQQMLEPEPRESEPDWKPHDPDLPF